MILPTQPPHGIGPQVAHAEPDHAEALPLADVHEFVTQQIRRRLTSANDDQWADGDAVSALRYRTTFPQAEALSMFDRHNRDCSPDISRDARLAVCGNPRCAGPAGPSTPRCRRTAGEHR